MTAPFTAAEQAQVDAWEAAAYAEESVRERMARAMFDAANPISSEFPDYWHRVSGGEQTRDAYRRLADAALAVIRTPVEEGP